jgi:hypothetical protein
MAKKQGSSGVWPLSFVSETLKRMKGFWEQNNTILGAHSALKGTAQSFWTWQDWKYFFEINVPFHVDVDQ